MRVRPLFLIGFCSIVLLVAANLFFNADLALRASGAPSTPRIEWKQAATIGEGCWPDCSAGQKCWPKACANGAGKWPLAIVPVVGPDGQLWMIGNTHAWSSQDGVNWTRSDLGAAWGERSGMNAITFKNKLWKLGGMERTWDQFRNDVWSSSDGKAWQRVVQHAPWSARRGHVTVVHGGKLWLFGGSESSGRADELPRKKLRDAWSTADGTTWERITEDLPWVDANVVTFKNRFWAVSKDGTWASADGRVWTQMSSASPFEWREAAGCLTFAGRIWLIGGMLHNDIWHTSDGVVWNRIPEKAPWRPRTAEQSVVFAGKLWLYGGKLGRDEGFSEEVWQFLVRP